MEITKQEFTKWFQSANLQIAGNAMRIQWTSLLEKQNPLFSEDELWNINGVLAAENLGFAVKTRPELLYPAIKMLQQRLIDEKKLPFEIWTVLMNLASYLLKNSDDKIVIRDFVALQKFEGQELNQMIATALRCVDQMPEWQDVALKWISQVEPDVNFCIVVQKFLTEWGRLDEYSNTLIVAAFDRLLPEWAPLMIKALTNVPGPYRFDLSLCLLKKYFNNQPMEVVKAIIPCFEKDSDVVLQQKLLDGIFNFFNRKEQKLELNVAEVFVAGVSQFLLSHWADNCFKFGNFWDKFHDAPEIFDIIRASLKDDLNFVFFNKGSDDKLAKLKTPLHMLCYLPVVNRIDLCILLLKVISRGENESRNLACQILVEKEYSLQFTPNDNVDDYYQELSKLLSYSHPVSYEMKLLVSAVVNALVTSGAEVKDVEKLYDFVQSYGLKVPALEERYSDDIKALLQQRQYEKEVLDYLLKH